MDEGTVQPHRRMDDAQGKDIVAGEARHAAPREAVATPISRSQLTSADGYQRQVRMSAYWCASVPLP